MKAFLNVDPYTLEARFASERGPGLSVPVFAQRRTQLPPIWEVIYYQVVYAQKYRQDREKLAAERQKGPCRAYALALPPFWFVTMASIMWEGVLQGAAWDVIKLAVSKALSLVSQAGIKAGQNNGEISTTVRGGFECYAKDGRKQYGLYLAVKRAVKAPPEGHAEAYARAGDKVEFGQLVRGEKTIEPSSRQRKRRPN